MSKPLSDAQVRSIVQRIADNKEKKEKQERRKMLAEARAQATGHLLPKGSLSLTQRQALDKLHRFRVQRNAPDSRTFTREQLQWLSELGPIDQLPEWAKEVLTVLGIMHGRSTTGRIPLGIALDWLVTYEETTAWCAKDNTKFDKRNQPQLQWFAKKKGKTWDWKETTFSDLLRCQAVKQFGRKRGQELFQRAVEYVLEYDLRDARKLKRKGGKKNAQRKPKFSTRSREAYYLWLLSRLGVVRKRQKADKAEIVVVAFVEGYGADSSMHDSSIRRTARSKTE